MLHIILRFEPLPHNTTSDCLNMAWIARGKTGDGFVQEASAGETAAVPALATHHGDLWCLWSAASGDVYYAMGDNNTFQSRVRFPDQGVPVMAESLGVLHALVVRPSGEIAHYMFDEIEQTWPEPVILDKTARTNTTPALMAFHNRLFVVYVQDETLYYAIWTRTSKEGNTSPRPEGASSQTISREESGTWTAQQEVSGISKVAGIPALFVLEGTLHVLCGSQDENRKVLGFAYSPTDDVWNSCDDISEGKAARGFSATSYGESAFLAFQENGPDDPSHAIYIAEFKNGKWLPHEPVAGQASADPPQLAVLNGRINCIFNANNFKKDLRWCSRPLLGFSLSSWMSTFPDETPLSNITIPGTHDSCARSNVPFVRTQYLSITKQLAAGIRFLDLRLRTHADGLLYCYHGGIAANWPYTLSFDSVMQEIFDFFVSTSSIPTETVLISINDDEGANREDFYNAVENATATYPGNWIVSPNTATLGQARGKAVLLRRYPAPPHLSTPKHIGLDLTQWKQNNPAFNIHTPTGIPVTIQDKWQYTEQIPLSALIDSKFSFVTAMLDIASSNKNPRHWYLNFSSAVGDPRQHGELAESRWIAVGARSGGVGGEYVKGVNVRLREGYEGLGTAGRKRFGIVAMDYPELPKESDLIARLVETNF